MLDGSTLQFQFSQINAGNINVTGTLSLNDVALSTYIDNIVSDLSVWSRKGVINASANPNYPLAENGDLYIISVGGIIGGGAGTSVEAGDIIIANADSVAGTQAAVGANWNIIQGNLAALGTMSLQNAGTVAITGGSATGLTDVKLTDDSILTLGTTLTNAATKVTLEFDKTTTGIGQIKLGDLSDAQVLNANPGATVCGSSVNILHSAGAGDCTDLLGGYTKVAISGDGDGDTTLVGFAPRAYILGGTTIAKEVYGCQPWAKHTGTGTVTALSALSAALLINDAEAFTATNSINAGHFHIYTPGGAANGAITSGNFDGVMIEVYPNVTGLDSMLHLAQDSTTVIDSAIKLTGTKVTNIFEIPEGDGCVIGSTAYGATANGYLVLKVGSTTYKIPFI